MKGFLTTLVVLAVLLVAADRVSLVLAERAVATQLQASGSLSSRPQVSVRGFPFLTQAFSGRYDDVELTATSVTAGGARLSRLEASLTGVHLPLSQALSGSVTAVPVDRVAATVLLTYADLHKQLRDRRLALSAAGDLLRVTGSVQVLGRTVSASALSSVTVEGASVVVHAQRFEVGGRAADRLVSAALGQRLDFVVRIGTLPYGLRLTGVRVQPDGIAATAAGTSTVLRPAA